MSFNTYTGIWRHFADAWIVIPTNIGWRFDGANVMGRGVARQAAQLFPDLPMRYGEFCETHGEDTPVKQFAVVRNYDGRQGVVVCFPVKPLDVDKPYLSWQGDASLELIEKSAMQLATLRDTHNVPKVVLPMVGCGCGNLSKDDVLPILLRCLPNAAFKLVKQG